MRRMHGGRAAPLHVVGLRGRLPPHVGARIGASRIDHVLAANFPCGGRGRSGSRPQRGQTRHRRTCGHPLPVRPSRASSAAPAAGRARRVSRTASRPVDVGGRTPSPCPGAALPRSPGPARSEVSTGPPAGGVPLPQPVILPGRGYPSVGMAHPSAASRTMQARGRHATWRGHACGRQPASASSPPGRRSIRPSSSRVRISSAAICGGRPRSRRI